MLKLYQTMVSSVGSHLNDLVVSHLQVLKHSLKLWFLVQFLIKI